MGIIKELGRELNLKCPWCGYEGKFKKRSVDIFSLSILIILFICLVIPGIIYALWHSQQEECPKCRAKVPRGPF